MMKRPEALQRQPLPGRTPEAEFLGQVGWWYVNSKEAQQQKTRIQKFGKKGLISIRQHRTTYGKVVDAYELTDAGLGRLEQIAGQSAANRARIHRQYLRDQARKNGVEPVKYR
jgi:DNA-binding PadR family transcriptional regulator